MLPLPPKVRRAPLLPYPTQMPDRFLVSELSVMTFILLVGGVEPLVSPQPPTDLLYDAVMNQWTVTCRTD